MEPRKREQEGEMSPGWRWSDEATKEGTGGEPNHQDGGEGLEK